MTDEIEDMRATAERFRRLASTVEDPRNKAQLLDMAATLEKQADETERTQRSAED